MPAIRVVSGITERGCTGRGSRRSVQMFLRMRRMICLGRPRRPGSRICSPHAWTTGWRDGLSVPGSYPWALIQAQTRPGRGAGGSPEGQTATKAIRLSPDSGTADTRQAIPEPGARVTAGFAFAKPGPVGAQALALSSSRFGLALFRALYAQATMPQTYRVHGAWKCPTATLHAVLLPLSRGLGCGVSCVPASACRPTYNPDVL